MKRPRRCRRGWTLSVPKVGNVLRLAAARRPSFPIRGVGGVTRRVRSTALNPESARRMAYAPSTKISRADRDVCQTQHVAPRATRAQSTDIAQRLSTRADPASRVTAQSLTSVRRRDCVAFTQEQSRTSGSV